MVRGWNDTGSRISVRFADTAEQRELRVRDFRSCYLRSVDCFVQRVERVNRDGENSPARLTMAQAALLNLKGTQLHPGAQAPRIPSPNFGLSPPPSNLSLSPDLYAPVSLPELPPPIGLHNQQALGDLRTLRTVHAHRNDGLQSQAADFLSSGLRLPAHTFGGDQGFSPDLLEMQMALDAEVANAARAQNGFTAMERLILQAHETRQQDAARLLQAQQRLASEFNVSAPDFHPSDGRLGGLQAATSVRDATSRKLMNVLPSMSEEDFHATSGGPRRVLHSTGNGGGSTLAGAKQDHKAAAPLTMDLEARLTFTRQRNQTAAEARAQAQAEAQAQALRSRSTTVPSHYLTSDRSNTQPLLNTRGISTGNAPAPHADLGSTSKDMPQASTIRMNNQLLCNTNDSIRNNLTSTGTRDNTAPSARDSSTIAPAKTGAISASSTAPANQLQTRIDTTLRNRKASLSRSDEEDEGSGLDSPALSYSASVRTPASLSPSTPFSAFGETFEGPPMAPGVKVSASAGEVGLGMGAVGVGLATNLKQKMRAAE